MAAIISLPEYLHIQESDQKSPLDLQRKVAPIFDNWPSSGRRETGLRVQILFVPPSNLSRLVTARARRAVRQISGRREPPNCVARHQRNDGLVYPVVARGFRCRFKDSSR